MDQVYGGFPPDAENGWEYGIPTVPANKGATVVIVRSAGFTVMLKVALAVRWPESATCTWNVNAPAAVGVPVIAPV
jgi:hypothetical protein